MPRTVNAGTWVAVALLSACVSAFWTAGAAAQGTPATPVKRPTVLFMCPHGAAKSVLASAYFTRLAKERGLDVRVVTAGIDADPAVAPKVVAHLKDGGYDLPVEKPQRVTEADLATADVIVSLGCDLKGLPPARVAVRNWDDVPLPSEDFAAADARIRERVAQLIDEVATTLRR